MKRTFLILVLAPSLLTLSCQKDELAAETENFGTTHRTRKAPLEKCRDVEGSLPVSSAYLKRLFEHMVSKNPQTFNGILSKDNFCVSVVLNDERNASARPKNGQIVFNSKILEEAPGDYYIAGVLGHELSHVTMDHGDIFLKHYWSKMTKADNVELDRLSSQLMRLEVENSGTYESLVASLKPDFLQIPNVQKPLFDAVGSTDQVEIDATVKRTIAAAQDAKACLKSCVDVEKRLRRFL